MSTSSHGEPAMDPASLLQLDQELDSVEVAALCFLCRDVISRKDLEKVQDAKELFHRMSERGLLKNDMLLRELLQIIHRNSLLIHLPNNGSSYDTDATPCVSNYRKMLYSLYDNCTKDNYDTITFLLTRQLGRRVLEKCKTALDIFVELERGGLISSTDVEILNDVMPNVDYNMAETVERYIETIPLQRSMENHFRMDQVEENLMNKARPAPGPEPISVDSVPVVSPSSPVHAVFPPDEYYPLTHFPRGPCVIINNENFDGLSKRKGTEVDEVTLRKCFTDLGFSVTVYNDLTGREMHNALQDLSSQDFSDTDVLVVFVLSHGENQSVYGTDGHQVSLKDLTRPFTSDRATSLAGKPKLFFIQACQGSGFETGASVQPQPKLMEAQYACDHIEDDAGPVTRESIPSQADILLGMATIPEHRSFRSIHKGSIYIQELCKQLRISAESDRNDDILTVLTRVNREISKQDLRSHKQMPQPKYTLTRQLVLKFAKRQ